METNEGGDGGRGELFLTYVLWNSYIFFEKKNNVNISRGFQVPLPPLTGNSSLQEDAT
jgi:hypothetical protein